MIYLKNICIWILKHAAIAVAAFVGIWIFHEWKKYNNSGSEIVNTKTKEVKEIHHYHEAANTQPVTNHIQITLDSSFRRQVERTTITTGIKFKPGELDVQSVDPKGKVSEKEYKIPEGMTGTLDSNGLHLNKTPFFSQLKLYGGVEVGMNQNGFNNLSPQLFLTSPTGWALNGSYNFMDNSKNVGVSKLIRIKRK